MAGENGGWPADPPAAAPRWDDPALVAAWTPPRFLDAASGLPPSPDCLRWLSSALTGAWADPVGRHPWAARSRAVIGQSRQRLADYLGCAPAQVWFAGTADLALATAVRAVAGGSSLPVAVGAIERLAVLRTADALPGGQLVIDVTPQGAVSIPTPLPPVSAVVVQAANREIGAVQDLAAVRAAAAGAPLIVDATAVRVRSALPAHWDVIVLDPSAWGGPPGVAVTACRARTPWTPLAPATADDRFPGRTPAALVAAAAMTLPDTAAHEAEDGRIRALAGHLAQRVQDTIPDAVVLSPAVGGLSYLVSLSLVYVNAEQLVDELSALGFGVHSGSACTSDLKRPSHVLTAVRALTHGNLRVSLPPGCTAAEIEDFAAALAGAVGRQRAEAGL